MTTPLATEPAGPLARAAADVDRATAAWDAAFAAALADGAPLDTGRLAAAEAALVRAYERWNAVWLASMGVDLRRAQETQRDAA